MTAIQNFSLYSRYYSLFYQEKDYAGEAAYVAQLIRSYLPDARRLLELGCGGGGHARHFVRGGMEVTGIDRSAEMVMLANSEPVAGFHAQRGDITGYWLNRKFDAAVSLFHVISYLTTNEALQACFQRTADHLHSGGLFIFDTWYTPAVYTQVPDIRVKTVSAEGLQVSRLATPESYPDENRVDVHYGITVRDTATRTSEHFEELHRMRHFSTPEIALLAELTGFRLLRAEEFLTGDEPSVKSWSVCYILQKK